jgi:hypothetical protein
MATIRGRDEYFVLRFSISSTAMTGSEMTIVGFLPIHIVNIGPYVFDHFWNCIHGLDLGSWSLLPMKGNGVGPGGIRSHNQTSWRRVTIGMAKKSDNHT